MKLSLHAVALAVCLAVPLAGRAAPDEKLMTEATGLRDQGEFEKATRVLQAWLDANTTAAEAADRRAVEFEVERIRRIRQDYTVTREKLIAQLQDRLTTFTETDLDNYEREGKLDVQLIDGQKLYVNSSASNLVLRVPELRDRLKVRKKDTAYITLYEQMLTARKAAKQTSLSLVLPQDYVVTCTVVVKPNAAPDGKTVRAWLPFVHGFPYQADVEILKSEPAPTAISSPESHHRTVYLERTAEKDQPVTFTLAFVYRTWARVHNLKPELVQEYDKNDPEYIYYTAERKPHIDFSSEELKRIDNEVSGGDANPLLLARRIYDWIARNTIYQYAREYSTLDNISQYTATRRAGDCGQHTMLFIALCRMNGIPARWTTGWESFNARGQNMHDWAEFYVKPWGWLPADPDMAVNVLNYANDELTTGQQTELANWLFGNMDNRRLTVNSDYGRSLYPEKLDFRSETVDFQRGEVESEGKNLYFDQWDWTMRIRPIDAKAAEDMRRKFVPAKVAMATPTPAPTPTPVPTPTPTPAPISIPTPPPPAPETTATATATTETASVDKTTTVSAGDSASTTPAVGKESAVATPVATPAPTPTPAITPAPEPTPIPAPKATPTPAPEPAAKPEVKDSGTSEPAAADAQSSATDSATTTVAAQ